MRAENHRGRLARILVVAIASIVLVFSCQQPGASEGNPATTTKATIRVVAANLSSGTGQSYTPGEGVRILQGTSPDVVLVQEFNYNGDGDSTSNENADFQIMANLVIHGSSSGANDGSQAYWCRGSSAENIPNGIISKYPILSSGEWDDSSMTDREFTWARIDIPGDLDLYAVSLHIKASDGSTNIAKRSAEAAALKDYVAANVPTGTYLVIGGDFNTYGMVAATETCLGVLDDFVTIPASQPVDQAGNADTSAGRSHPYDHVFANPALDACSTAVLIGGYSFVSGLVVDTRTSVPYSLLASLSPAFASDSGDFPVASSSSNGMQHMAVVRDFLVDGD